MPSTLRTRLAELAFAFADGVLAALRGAGRAGRAGDPQGTPDTVSRRPGSSRETARRACD